VRLSLRKLRLYGRVEISLLREGPPGSKDLLAVWRRKKENAAASGHHHHHHVRTGVSLSGNTSFVPLASVGAGGGPSSTASGSAPHGGGGLHLGVDRGVGSSTGVAGGVGVSGHYMAAQGEPLPRRSGSGITTFLS
jgi:hypothetical protein